MSVSVPDSQSTAGLTARGYRASVRSGDLFAIAGASLMSEVFFLVEESHELRYYTAWALGSSIFTEADDWRTSRERGGRM